MIQSAILFIMLVVCSVEDLKTKEIKTQTICIFGIVGILLHLWFSNLKTIDMLGGMAVGIILLIVSKIFKNSVGEGDGIILVISGIYLGMNRNMELFFYSILLSGIFSAFLFFFFHKKKEYEIPFVPFLCLGYMGVLFL